MFKATRALEGGPRWSLAQNDVPSLPANMLKDFSCAVGTPMSPEATPKLMAMLSKMGIDASREVSAVKDVFKRQRPYIIAGDGNICTPKSDSWPPAPTIPRATPHGAGPWPCSWRRWRLTAPPRSWCAAAPSGEPGGLRRPQRQRHRSRPDQWRRPAGHLARQSDLPRRHGGRAGRTRGPAQDRRDAGCGHVQGRGGANRQDPW
uniref:Uncharacterized protein n=1 Tax=Phenylobacterium glaciei TaxID=2803784 RepID=A0A974P5L7_9CAUL|nr:hypothetical protein JKL49_05705 [Phenylobacterium glaciei]